MSTCSPTAIRPCPLAAGRVALEHAERVVVIEKSLAVGLGGVVSDGVRKALSGIVLHGHTVIAGLGGRSITRKSLRALFERAERGELGQLEFLDLDTAIVERELTRIRQQRRAGPTAEAILRELGTVASQIR